MSSHITQGSERPTASIPRPHHRLVVPDPLETWTLDEVDFLLWPNSAEHLPSALNEEEAAELAVFGPRKLQ